MDKAKEEAAIKHLQAFEPEEEPYWLAYSGGKDSDCIRILADLAGVKYDSMYSMTTVDAPETMRYIHSVPGVQTDRRELNMRQLIVKNRTPPYRTVRYCCGYYKESSGKGRLKITGVRKSESPRRKKLYDNAGVTIVGRPVHTRKKADELNADYAFDDRGGVVLNDDNDSSRKLVEYCYKNTRVTVNPLIEWTDDDVWEFLQYYGCESNPLYKEGFNRIGCVGCPMEMIKDRKRDFERWPGYKKMYLLAFEEMLEVRRNDPKNEHNTGKSWETAEEVMEWWLGHG